MSRTLIDDTITTNLAKSKCHINYTLQKVSIYIHHLIPSIKDILTYTTCDGEDIEDVISLSMAKLNVQIRGFCTQQEQSFLNKLKEMKLLDQVMNGDSLKQQLELNQIDYISKLDEIKDKMETTSNLEITPSPLPEKLIIEDTLTKTGQLKIDELIDKIMKPSIETTDENKNRGLLDADLSFEGEEYSNMIGDNYLLDESNQDSLIQTSDLFQSLVKKEETSSEIKIKKQKDQVTVQAKGGRIETIVEQEEENCIDLEDTSGEDSTISATLSEDTEEDKDNFYSDKEEFEEYSDIINQQESLATTIDQNQVAYLKNGIWPIPHDGSLQILTLYSKKDRTFLGQLLHSSYRKICVSV